jgi:hypothetical protein
MDPSKIDRNKIKAEYESLNKKINEMVQICIQKFENPIHLCKFASSMKVIFPGIFFEIAKILS